MLPKSSTRASARAIGANPRSVAARRFIFPAGAGRSSRPCLGAFAGGDEQQQRIRVHVGRVPGAAGIQREFAAAGEFGAHLLPVTLLDQRDMAREQADDLVAERMLLPPRPACREPRAGDQVFMVEIAELAA